MLAVLVRNWWAVALRGVVAILLGAVAILRPGIALRALVLLFGAYALVDGLFAIVSAIRAARQHERWWSFLLEGIAGILAGIIAFLWPAITLFVLLYIVAAWAVVTGIMEITAAIRLRREITGEWLLVLAGLLSVIYGIFLMFFPPAGLISLVWLLGIYAIVFGVLLLSLALRLRAMGKAVPAPARA